MLKKTTTQKKVTSVDLSSAVANALSVFTTTVQELTSISEKADTAKQELDKEIAEKTEEANKLVSVSARAQTMAKRIQSLFDGPKSKTV